MSAFGGNYNNPPFDLMGKVKGFFDRQDAERKEQLDANRNHAQTMEQMSMHHQHALEQIHAQGGVETGLIKTRGSQTRRNATLAARLSTDLPEGGSMNVNESNINVVGKTPGPKTRSTATRTKAATKTAAPAKAKTTSAPKTTAAPAEPPKTRGQKAAETRARNKAAAAQQAPKTTKAQRPPKA